MVLAADVLLEACHIACIRGQGERKFTDHEIGSALQLGVCRFHNDILCLIERHELLYLISYSGREVFP
jgi:hypothetical protein